MTLSAERVVFGYRRNEPILREASARFAPGRIAAVLGPNGAGKSTLLRALLGAIRPWSGVVSLAGRPLREIPAAARVERLAYVPQRPEIAGAFSARRVVEMGRHALTGRPALVERAIGALELGPIVERPFATLSVGQQQRVALARALAQLGALDEGESLEGKALLADEPMSAMDPRFMGLAAGALRDAARRGCAVVVVLHDATAALRLSDDIVALSCEGRVVASGQTADTLTPAMLGALFGTRFLRLESADAGALLPALGARPGGESAPPRRYTLDG